MLHAVDVAVIFDGAPSPLFHNLNLSVTRHDRIAVVGPNGSGKSTLLDVLGGTKKATSGRIVLDNRSLVVKLDQEPREPEQPALLGSRIFRRHLSLLGVQEDPLLKSWMSHSSGERMKIALAAALSEDPDVLLLDEPTNHLDRTSMEWMKSFLQEISIGLVFATHDRSLVDQTATRVLEIERGEWRIFQGGYSSMCLQKEIEAKARRGRFEHQTRERNRLKRTAEETLQRASQMTRAPIGADAVGLSRPHYAALQKKLDKRAKAIKTRVEHSLRASVEKPFESKSQKLEFFAAPTRDQRALEVRDCAATVDGRQILSSQSFDVAACDRLAVLGANGVGKTTLLKLFVEAGPGVTHGRGVVCAYLPQDRDLFAEGESVLEFLSPQNQEHETQIRILLGRLGVRGEMAHRNIECLSVGERSRIALVKIILSRSNLLILDEPTNHLDLPALTALEEALVGFPGAIVFTSHDAAFVERLASSKLEIQKPDS